jgi:hypothetical protein
MRTVGSRKAFVQRCADPRRVNVRSNAGSDASAARRELTENVLRSVRNEQAMMCGNRRVRQAIKSLAEVWRESEV